MLGMSASFQRSKINSKNVYPFNNFNVKTLVLVTVRCKMLLFRAHGQLFWNKVAHNIRYLLFRFICLIFESLSCAADSYWPLSLLWYDITTFLLLALAKNDPLRGRILLNTTKLCNCKFIIMKYLFGDLLKT